MRASGKSVGASVWGNRGGSPSSTFGAALSFSQTPYRASRYFATSSKPPRPGASSFERLISDSFLFSRLAARSRVSRCVTGYDLAGSCRVPPRVPQGGTSPNHLRGGCPATARLAGRFNQYDAGQSTANTEAPFRFASRIFCGNQAAKPQRIESHARRFATGTRSCAASPARFSLVVSSATDDSFRFAVEILPTPVKILLAALRSNLTGSGWISLGKTKKILGGLRGLFRFLPSDHVVYGCKDALLLVARHLADFVK